VNLFELSKGSTPVDADVLLFEAIEAGTPVNALGDVRLKNGLVVAKPHVRRRCVFCTQKTHGRVVLATWSGDIRRADVVCSICCLALAVESNKLLLRILEYQTSAAQRGKYRPVSAVIRQVRELILAASELPAAPTAEPTTSQVLSDIEELLGPA